MLNDSEWKKESLRVNKVDEIRNKDILGVVTERDFRE